MKRTAVLLALGLAAGAAVAWAQDWGNFALISNTLGVNANRLCIGEGVRPNDIGCPAYTPTVDATGLMTVTNVSVTGDVSVTGNVSANKFIGDGSELTGVTAASGDRIVSGTTSMIAISNTGYISITTGGVTTGYFTPAGVLVANGISVSTNRMSATTGYFSGNVGIGIDAPSANLHVAGTISATDAIQVGSSSLDCTAGIHGALRFESGALEVCDGSNWGSTGGGALGDRIISGTLAVVANSETSIISLSTDGTDWGYLRAAGNSFLPRLGSNFISSTLISTTYVQLNSATEVIECGAGFTGAMRYISGTMQVCDGNAWGNVGGSIPGGTISAFEAATCPSGWTEYTPARGRFLRGLDNGAGNDPDWPRASGSTQADELGSHLHSVDPPNTGTSAAGNHNHSYLRYSNKITRASGGGGSIWNGNTSDNTGSSGNHAHTVNIAAFNSANTGGVETRPKNVAVIFCQYAGYNATLEVGIATLASLSDVSVGGATLNQVLTFDGGSWVPSDTASNVNAMDDLSDVDTSGVAAGSYLRYDGSDWVVSTTHDVIVPDGDRITSGTLAVIANSETSIVSLSTAGTTWGYLSSGASYLPTLTAGKVSSTNISGTYVQLSSATTVLACGAGLEGTMRYTSGTMQVCDGFSWGNIGIGVPTGTIAAFEASSCPAGWSEYAPARGRFLRGIDTLAAGIDPSGTRTPGDTQEDAFQGHEHTQKFTQAAGQIGAGGGIGAPIPGATEGVVTNGVHGTPRTANETRPKNVAVTFCQYAGYNSELQTGVATLASLSDVSVGGATSGQALVFDGASWVPSTTSSVGAFDDLTDVDTSGASAGDVVRYDGANWVISSSGGGTLATLTDVSASAPFEGALLRYNDAESKWEAVGASAAMSTSTMVANWPDALVCTLTNPNWGKAIFYAMHMPLASNGDYYYRSQYVPNATTYDIRFNSDGTFSAYTNLTTTDCNKTISTLYAEGKAVNFIGGDGGGGGSLATLTDVSTTAYEGAILRYNDTIDKWEAVDVSTAMSTTTMVANWPDAIICGYNNGNGDMIYAQSIRRTGNQVEYVWDQGPASYYVYFNMDGSAKSASQPTTWNQSCAGKSISQLYIEGRAFDFIGGSGSGNNRLDGLVDVSASAPLGDGMLRYNDDIGKWEMLAPSVIMSTTTIMSGWPDAIVCGTGSWEDIAYLVHHNGKYYYRFNWAAGDYTYVFNADGTMDSATSTREAGTDCAGKSISTLYAEGRAFNLIGNNGVGGGSLATLTDVSISTPNDGSILRYNGGNSRWEEVDFQDAVSTSTMNVNWPDAIKCYSTTSYEYIFYFTEFEPDGDGKYRLNADIGVDYQIVYDGTTQAFKSSSSAAVLGDCHSSAYSIPQLYALGRAYNFIGGSGGISTSSALGDRITSGTMAAIANSATSYISLSANGTTWGYLSSGASYLPTLSAAKVSPTTISTTYMQLSSASTVLACNTAATGTMRYTSGTMQVCDGSEWGNIGIGVPTGTIAAFEASSCPAGWSEYTPARGRFLRGIDTLAAGIDPSGTRAAGDTQGDTLQNITGNFKIAGSSGGVDGTSGVFHLTSLGATYPTQVGGGHPAVGMGRFDASRVVRTSSETRPKNVAVTFCQYAGFDSELSAGVATLASLSDVSVGGATTGQALVFDGASWVPSTTTGGASAMDDLTDVDTSGVAAGSYLRYDGSDWVVSTTHDVTIPDGDRITSGTLAVIANSETSIISLSTAGTDWGYLASGASYLPTLTAARVSSTNVSATYVQLADNTALSCGGSQTGTLRYASGTVQVCDGSNWGNIGIGVPTGTIAAFEASSCPNGWSEYTASRGRFLRGIDNGAGNDPDGTRAAADTQDDALQGHHHSVSDGRFGWTGSGTGGSIFGNGTRPYAVVSVDDPISDGSNGIPRTANETRPKNVAVTFCQYAGFDSELSAGVATLASLSDVAVGGATTGQVLIFDGASWIASDTSGGGSGRWNDVTDLTYLNANPVGIGLTVSDGVALNVGGTVSATGLYINGDIQYTGVITDVSDRRRKTDIAPLEPRSLEELMKLNPVSFRMKGEGAALELGFIAQEVEKVFPELVRTADDEAGTKSLNYTGFIAPIVKAIQELRDWVMMLVDELRGEDERLRQSDEDLRGELQQLRRELKAANDNINALRMRLDAANDNDVGTNSFTTSRPAKCKGHVVATADMSPCG